MGMFDEIVVHRKLPLPKQLPDELRDVKWKEVVFQTKCLENCLTHYKIAVNGKLYAQKFDDEGNVFAYNAFFDAKKKDAAMFWKNMPPPASINFYTTFQEKEFDYWISFIAFFDQSSSKLAEIRLDQFDKEDNAPRKEKQKRLDEKAAANNKFYKKFIYKIYNIFWKKPLRYLLAKASKAVSKIERKFFPW